MKKIRPWIELLVLLLIAFAIEQHVYAQTFSLYAPANGIQANTGSTYQNTAVNGNANNIVATPNGSSGNASVRAMVNADLPATAVTPGSYTAANITVNQQGVLTAASNGTAGPTAANPTGTVGLSTVNGSATTFMRSDAAPPLSQSIAPTMTGDWTWTPASGVAQTINGKAGQTSILLNSNNTSGNQTPDIQIIRAAGTSNTLCTGPCISLTNNSTTGTQLQNAGGQTELWQFVSPSWHQSMFLDANGSTHFVAGAAATSPLFVLSMKSNSAVTGYVCYSNTAGELFFDTTATCPASSQRFKHAIQSIDFAEREIEQFRSVTYKLNDGPDANKTQLGFVAEEVAKIDPLLVTFDPDGKTARAVQYDKFTVLLVKAAQEQQRQILELFCAVGLLAAWNVWLTIKVRKGAKS